ncbi:MAG: hypothetical protein HYZ28_05155 [Myxococcales bacterium]|nr:hypothetical protein [Myxococcales bacterium]
MSCALESVAAALAQIPLPGSQPGYGKPEGDTTTSYVDLIDSNSHIIYPVVAIVALALLVAGILYAWKSQDMDGLQKAEFKKEILHELRKQMGGASAEALGRAVGLEPFKLVKLLEELQHDGVLVCHTNTQRLTVWQIKGVGPAHHR